MPTQRGLHELLTVLTSAFIYSFRPLVCRWLSKERSENRGPCHGPTLSQKAYSPIQDISQSFEPRASTSTQHLCGWQSDGTALQLWGILVSSQPNLLLSCAAHRFVASKMQSISMASVGGQCKLPDQALKLSLADPNKRKKNNRVSKRMKLPWQDCRLQLGERTLGGNSLIFQSVRDAAAFAGWSQVPYAITGLVDVGLPDCLQGKAEQR